MTANDTDAANNTDQPPREPLERSDRLLLRAGELAERCGVCEKTVRRWISEQGLPCVRLAAAGARETTFIRPEDFDQWIESKATATAARGAASRPSRRRPPRRFL